jgi:MtrB/PioB family decaheme-associated outer membrane protein
MKSPTPPQLTAAGALALAAAGATAGEPELYTPLALQHRPPLQAPTGYDGMVQLGLAYTSDDNFMFGQYNGLNEEGASLIGNLRWQDFSGESYWRLSLSDLGLETREGTLTWGRAERLKITASFDSQLQVRNDSGRTPFNGERELVLPQGWVSGLYTGDFSALDQSLHRFDRELDRDRLALDLQARLSERWRLEGGISYEEKQGTAEVGAPIYINAASADAVLLPAPVDQNVLELVLGLLYSGQRLHLEGRLGYSDFDNDERLLTWQNPYSSYGAAVRYPQGVGGLGVAPDNQQRSARLTGHYIFSPTARLQFDGSYALASQDQNYLDYSVNPLLEETVPPPRDNLDGEVATSTFNTRLLLRPLAKLDAEAFYKVRDRDYDAPRDNYQYVPGDGRDQLPPALAVYNTSHDYLSQTAGFELAYRLPLRSRLRFEYEFEKVERENAAVEETEESRSTLGYRIQPRTDFSASAELLYADRSADTYHWDQSYYALLDVELINATPDNQRYLNHPDLSQFYLSNRERLEAKLDLNYLPSTQWNLNLNLLWRDDDYDQSELGLTDAQWWRAHLSAGYTAASGLSATLYGGYDRYESDQTGRAFNGGQEKNAFAVYPPLPQASDPASNWNLDGTDTGVTLGANLQWQATQTLSLELDYSYVDTTSEQDIGTGASVTPPATNLPDVDTRLHHLLARGTWQLRENLSLRLDYSYYDYDSNDWAWRDVRPDTIGKVLTFGERNPDEEIHYVGASVIYRWQ